MTACDHCGHPRAAAGASDWQWRHWIRTGHHITDTPALDEADQIVRDELERIGHFYDQPTISDPPGREV